MQLNADLNRKLLFCLLMLLIPFAAAGQTKKSKTPAKKAPVPVAVKRVDPAVDATPVIAPPKKNERPADANLEPQDKSNTKTAKASGGNKPALPTPSYFYEFSQPNFSVSKIVIEHDEFGNGTLEFVRNSAEAPISDPILIAPAALERINKALVSINFLDSNENYQFEKDYSHLGAIKFRYRKDGRERSTAFNWTTNKGVRAFADEYRKIGNQFLWIFDISVARDNQPLETPKLFDYLESMIKRNEISDPKQMTLFLKSLIDDERLPLIARNHAAKIVKRIENESK